MGNNGSKRKIVFESANGGLNERFLSMIVFFCCHTAAAAFFNSTNTRAHTHTTGRNASMEHLNVKNDFAGANK